MQSLQDPEDHQEINFFKAKDVEQCFGVMKAKWNMADIANVMCVGIIMHNMIMEDERGKDLEIRTPQVAFSSSARP